MLRSCFVLFLTIEIISAMAPRGAQYAFIQPQIRRDLHTTTPVSAAPLAVSPHDEYADPVEVQNALCNIVSDEIKASANATITRQLKGVCHAKEVRLQLRHVEVSLLREIRKLQRAILEISSSNRRPVLFRYLNGRP